MLLPVDSSQLDYLFNRLLSAPPVVIRVLRQALERHQSGLMPRLWTVLDSVTPDDVRLLTSASSLALYDPNDKARWHASAGKVAEALVSVNSRDLGLWLDLLRPVRLELTEPLAAIFHDRNRSPSAHSLATDILGDYAMDDARLLAQLLMDADPQAYLSLFPGVATKKEDVIPEFLAELRKTAAYPWNDPSFKPPETLELEAKNRLELAHGFLNDHFAFCQTMPLADFLSLADSLEKSGYRPTRFRPFADGNSSRVAAVWTRDGRHFRLAPGLSAEEIRHQDEKNQSDKYQPADVAGYVATGIDGKPVDRFAAIWVERKGDDNAHLYVGLSFEEEGKAQNRLKEAKLVPHTMHVFVGADGKSRHCGVWGRPEGAFIKGQVSRVQFEGSFEQDLVTRIELPLRDVSIWGVQRSFVSSPCRVCDQACGHGPEGQSR